MSPSEDSRQPLINTHVEDTTDDALEGTIRQKQQEVFEQEEAIYKLRHEEHFDSEDIHRERLSNAIEVLHQLEKELSQLRLSQSKQFEDQLKEEADEETDISLPQPAVSSQHDKPGAKEEENDQKKTVTVETVSPSTISAEDQERGTMARARWDKVLNVMSAAKKWKNKWINTRTAVASAILEEESKARSPTSKMTKEKILNLRSSLYALRKKKNPTEREKSMINALQLRLRQLDGKYQQTLQDRHSEMLNAVTEEGGKE